MILCWLDHTRKLCSSVGWYILVFDKVGPWHEGISLLKLENGLNPFVQQYATSLTLFKLKESRWVW